MNTRESSLIKSTAFPKGSFVCVKETARGIGKVVEQSAQMVRVEWFLSVAKRQAENYPPHLLTRACPSKQT